MTLPRGIVTFLFTDIEGSTRLVADIGDAAFGGVLAEERALVEQAAAAEGGVPFGSEGDAHFVAFESPAAAIRAAVRAQRALADHPWGVAPVRVRMGIHTGEAQLVGDDYVGLEVHRVARVATAAHGGQVLVTEATRMLAGEPGAGVGLRDLGEHRLKDLARPERLYQVEAPGLATTFPAPRTLDATPNNLPPQLTSFVGRAEVARAAELLGRTRLLTLTGPGGTGKTRLSLALAGDCVDRFPDGAWFVPLAPVTEPELVAPAIAASLGLLAPNREPLDLVRDHLRDRRSLLVLDNFEQVVDAGPIVADLLTAAPRLTVVVSSRAPLRVAGEQEFPVPPLSLPPPGATDLDTLLASEAVRLFVERAMAVRPDFTLGVDNGPHVAEIVRRLDGLPLAIELAAARVRILSPAAMAQRLGDRLGLLGAGSRDLPARQQTLRGAIGWSYDLLDAADRRLFARLGVFAGGGALEIAETVCAVDGGGPLPDVLGGIERLAEQSLVRVEPDAHDHVRFTMLETIREYSLEKLAELGELAEVRERHAAAFLAFAERSGGDDGGARARWLDELEDEHDNLRAALDHLVASGDRERAARLGAAVWRFWQMRGHVVEGRARMRAVLAMPGWEDHASTARLRALDAAGGLAYWAGDMVAASELYGTAVTEARRVGDEAELANALYNRFFAKRPGSGVEDWIAGLADDDKSTLDEALEIWTRLGDELGMAKALWALGEFHTYRKELGEAEDVLTRALAIFERRGDGFWSSWARFTRAFGRLLARRVSPAAEDLAAALREFRATRDVSGALLVMAGASSVLLLGGRTRDAYALGAVVRRAVAETGLHIASLWPVSDVPSPDLDTTDPVLRAALAEGAAWTREEALDRAIEACEELARGAPEGSSTAS